MESPHTHFDYACIAWYPKLNVKLKILKNKCIRVCLKLDKMHHSSEEDYKTINWLPVDQRVYANNVCPYYMKEVYEHATQIRISSRNNYPRDLKFLFKTITRGRKVCHILVWNKFPSSIKRNISLNTFKYDVNKIYLQELRM